MFTGLYPVVPHARAAARVSGCGPRSRSGACRRRCRRPDRSGFLPLPGARRQGPRPVIVLHGYAMNRANFVPLAFRLARAGLGPIVGFEYWTLGRTAAAARQLGVVRRARPDDDRLAAGRHHRPLDGRRRRAATTSRSAAATARSHRLITHRLAAPRHRRLAHRRRPREPRAVRRLASSSSGSPPRRRPQLTRAHDDPARAPTRSSRRRTRPRSRAPSGSCSTTSATSRCSARAASPARSSSPEVSSRGRNQPAYRTARMRP